MPEIIEGGFSIAMPKLIPVKQLFAEANHLFDAKAEIHNLFFNPKFKEIIPGSRIALAVGSRGIEGIDKIVGSFIKELKKIGALPFIVPAM